MMTPADIKLCVHELQEAIAASTTGAVTLQMSTHHARLFVDFLQHMDPDMPPAPLCKVLGPLVGDYMMNTKLDRLDKLANKLGPMVLLLTAATARDR